MSCTQETYGTWGIQNLPMGGYCGLKPLSLYFSPGKYYIEKHSRNMNICTNITHANAHEGPHYDLENLVSKYLILSLHYPVLAWAVSPRNPENLWQGSFVNLF